MQQEKQSSIRSHSTFLVDVAISILLSISNAFSVGCNDLISGEEVDSGYHFKRLEKFFDSKDLDTKSLPFLLR